MRAGGGMVVVVVAGQNINQRLKPNRKLNKKKTKIVINKDEVSWVSKLHHHGKEIHGIL